MINAELPPPPPPGASGPDICAIMQHYMAVVRDLSSEQQRALTVHLRTCQECVHINQAMKRVTAMVADLEDSSPSARVDQAVLAAIAARVHEGRARRGNTPPVPPLILRQRRRVRSRYLLAGMVAAAVLLLLAAGVLYALIPLLNPAAQAFVLPANLSWSSYVLYHSQTMMSAHGHSYQVITYHNLADDAMNVETLMKDELDVVVVKNEQKTLGLDMMHHVAQWDVSAWLGEEPVFNLEQLRSDLRSGQAVYLGKDQFQGQECYRIRDSKGQVLLLSLQYQPLNVLGTAGKPIYDTFHVMQASQVSASMWDMSMPDGFKMGQLPARDSMLSFDPGRALAIQ